MSNYTTTKQFMEEVRKMGFEVFLNNFYGSIEVFDKETKKTLAYVSSDCNMGLNTIYRHWDNFNDETKTKLYNLLDRYARTPLDK